MARYPRTTPAISTASLPVLARRFLADPHEVGRIEGIGLAFFGSWSRRRPGPAHRGQRRTRPPAAGPRSRPDTSTRATSFRAGDLVDQGQRRPRAGHCRRLWERLWERRRELGANTYRVLVHPTSTEKNANPAGHALKPARRSSVQAPRNRRHRGARPRLRSRQSRTYRGARLPRIRPRRPRTASFEPDTSRNNRTQAP